MKINKMFVNGNIINITSNDEKVSKYKSNKTKPIIEKTLDATYATSLAINSLDANVHLVSGNTNQISVNVYSSTQSNLDVSVSFFTPKLVRIIVRKTYTSYTKNTYNIATDNSLRIEVVIPNKLFNLISIKSTNGNITIDSSVTYQNLELSSTNGNITTKSPFERTIIYSVNGNVTMQICATSNSELHINNSNGNVNITLSNFQKNNINASSFNGCYKNLYYPSGQYDIWGKISSMNGNIYIK